MLSRRRGRLHFAGHAALPPAMEATTAEDTEAEAEATDTESGLGGGSCVVAWCRLTLGHWQRAQLPSLLPPSPSFTYYNYSKTTEAVANDGGGGADGGSSFRARRSGSGGVDEGRYREHTALWGLAMVDPTGGTVYPHRCMLPHVTLVAGRRARQRRRRSGGGDNKTLFGDGAAICSSSASSAQWHGIVVAQSCAGTARRGGCGCSSSRRGGISDFGAAAESDKGWWVRPTLIATARLDIGRGPVRPFTPDLGLEVEEGCGPCVLRPPAPWDTQWLSERRRQPWVGSCQVLLFFQQKLRSRHCKDSWAQDRAAPWLWG